MADSQIIAAARSINGAGDLSAVKALIETAKAEQKQCVTLTIDDLGTPWQNPVQQNHFRSGCGPIEALSVANRLIHNGDAELVIISGRDFIKSDYSQAERHKRMVIYPEASLPEAYTQLARHFCDHEGLSTDAFFTLRDAVFENMKKTATELDLKLPTDNWYAPLTDLFRGVDCANPVIDFEGLLVVAHPDSTLEPLMKPVAIKGVGIGIADNDGPEHARELARYHALEKAVHYAEVQSGFNVADIINNPESLLEAYTCYPVVPLALLIKAGARQTESDILQWLQSKALTCTGGMNLGRGPWNNPALNGLIAVCEKLQKQQNQVPALVHGNGGLGYKQGIALLTCNPAAC